MSNRLHCFHWHKQGLTLHRKVHISRTLFRVSICSFETAIGAEDKIQQQDGLFILSLRLENEMAACAGNVIPHDHLPETKVRENQAPKATEAIPPIALTRKTCPKDSILEFRSQYCLLEEVH